VDWIHLTQDRELWRTLEHSNEPSSSIKGGEFSYLSDDKLLNSYCAPWKQN
jgi:hypothetical protein